jgi:hypothetical protein
MSQEESEEKFAVAERSGPFLGWTFLFHHFIHGLFAFLVFELCLSSLLRALGLSRNRGFLFAEFLLFACVSGLTYAYTLLSQQNARTQRALSQGLSRLQEHSQLRNAYQSLVQKLESISAGIRESLSAIMFFTRAHLIGAENTQKARDLREIAERIDQVQLLLREVQSSVDEEFGRPALVETFLADRSPPTIETESVIQAEGSVGLSPDELKSRAKSASSLRKSARKVLILPVVVRFAQAEDDFEFQTFTVNVCEEGACIILSSALLTQEKVIDVQVPPEFAARARLKWVQPGRANSFRLGGIEFLGSKFKLSPA